MAAEALLTIVVPVYNEGDNIGKCLEQIKSQVTVPYSVSVVYDFPEDSSLPVAREMAGLLKMPVELVRNAHGRGALNAIKTGLQSARTEFVIVTMADLSDPPHVMNMMIEVAKTHGADIVCGSRYMKGGSQTGGPLLKSLLSRMAGVSLHYVTRLPTHDVTNSFKLYRRSFLEKVKIESTGGFELGMELVVKAYRYGYKVTEVPTSWQDRSAGESRFQLTKWLPKYLRWYFYCLGWTADSPRKHSLS